jgi:hypothetical protein
VRPGIFSGTIPFSSLLDRLAIAAFGLSARLVCLSWFR